MTYNKDLDVDVDDNSQDGRSIPNGFSHDPGMDGLSLYEKKALLVNRELDAHGMGKYGNSWTKRTTSSLALLLQHVGINGTSSSSAASDISSIFSTLKPLASWNLP